MEVNAQTIITTVIVIFIALAVGSALLPVAKTQSESFSLNVSCANAGCFYNQSQTFCQVSTGNGTECTEPMTNYNPTGNTLFGAMLLVVMVGFFIYMMTLAGWKR